MKKKIFQLFFVFSVIFSFLRKSHYFRELSISACRPHDIRNLLIKSNKKKNLEFYPTAVYRWGHLKCNKCSICFISFDSIVHFSKLKILFLTCQCNFLLFPFFFKYYHKQKRDIFSDLLSWLNGEKKLVIISLKTKSKNIKNKTILGK
jgi:hypothetical protein